MGVLTALSVVVAVLFAPTVPVITAVIVGVAAYCLLKTYRTHQLDARLTERIEVLHTETE